MDGWIAINVGTQVVYVKPIDWEEAYVVIPDRQGTGYEVQRRSISGGKRVIGTGPSPIFAARQVDNGGHL